MFKKGYKTGIRRSALAVCPIPHIEEQRDTSEVIHSIRNQKILASDPKNLDFRSGFIQAKLDAVTVASQEGDLDCQEIAA